MRLHEPTEEKDFASFLDGLDDQVLAEYVVIVRRNLSYSLEQTETKKAITKPQKGKGKAKGKTKKAPTKEKEKGKEKFDLVQEMEEEEEVPLKSETKPT
jgi:hypothetical protein